MRSVIPMRTAKIGAIIISLFFCVLGTVLVFCPEFSSSVLGLICGITFVLFGVIKLVGYFSRDLYRLAFQYDLPLGILMTVMGTLIISRPERLMSFLSLIVGISVLVEGVFKLQISRDAKTFGIGSWWVIAAAAVLSVICGAVLILCPSDGGRVLTVLCGITLLAEGILNLGTMITAVKIVKNQKPDILYAEYEERKD